ncbi:Mu transposase domain-containing protein, partial [Brevibacillus migulae]|uniref:Mu transposase domain-containing protein n=1 Tax=Brevibacillus migulae TaxID=1644114 RepID=UPI0038B2ED10
MSYQGNRYSVPYQHIGYLVQIQDDRNGILRIYHDNSQIAEHVKISASLYQVAVNKKHFEGIRRTNS